MKPLAGRRILITRARHQAGSLHQSLQALGAEVVVAPMIEIAPPDSYAPLDDALRNLSQYDWLVLTSANGAAALWSRMEALGLSVREMPAVQVAAVGSATAHALEQQGWTIHALPKAYVAEAVVDALRDKVAGRRVLLIRARIARDVIPEELARLGARVQVVDAYQTVIPVDARQQMQAIFADVTQFPQVVMFTSSSTVKHFFLLFHAAGWALLPKNIVVASIGPITSQTLREHGVEPEIEAEEHSVPGLVEAMTAYFSGRP